MDYARRHLRFGWWSLLVFATLGLLLESLQGFKVRAYLDVSNETRRLMWTLAHAHGTLLALVHVIFGLTLRATPPAMPHLRLISCSLVAASVLLGMYVHPYFYWFTLFVGLNLFQSAFSGWCPMMAILRKAGVRG